MSFAFNTIMALNYLNYLLGVISQPNLICSFIYNVRVCIYIYKTLSPKQNIIKLNYIMLSICPYSMFFVYARGDKLIFTEGYFNMAAIKGPVVTVRLYKHYYSLTYC